MTVETFHNNPKGFRDQALAYLMKAETENNLIIGLSARLAEAVLLTTEALFWTVREGTEIRGAAMCTPPRDIILSHPFPHAALAALTDFLTEKRLSLPGVLGPDYAAHEFSERWVAATGSKAELWRRERVYRLDSVERLPLPPGHIAKAERRHVKLLTSYIEGFLQETGETGDASATLEAAISQGRLFIWLDGEPVSMSAWSGPTPNGVRITMVYTPPDLRRRGYATAVVSALSRQLLDQGKSFCSLYTDLSNPTSNNIYQRIGYKPILDCHHYRFVS